MYLVKGFPYWPMKNKQFELVSSWRSLQVLIWFHDYSNIYEYAWNNFLTNPNILFSQTFFKKFTVMGISIIHKSLDI